jgi:hypothetical protein
MIRDGGNSSKLISLSERDAHCYNILARGSCVRTRWKQSEVSMNVINFDEEFMT